MIEQEPPKRKSKVIGALAGYTDEKYLSLLLTHCEEHGRKFCERCYGKN